MTAVDVNAILDGFKKVIADNVPGLRSYGAEPDSFDPPGIFWQPSEMSAATLAGNSRLLTFRGVLLAPESVQRNNQAQLFAFAAAVEEALNADDTALDGSVSGLLSIGIEANQFYGTWTIGGRPLPCTILTVDVITG